MGEVEWASIVKKQDVGTCIVGLFKCWNHKLKDGSEFIMRGISGINVGLPVCMVQVDQVEQ